MIVKRFAIFMTLIAVAALGLPGLVIGQVRDNASMFSSDAVAKAEQQIKAIEARGKQLVIETYATLPQEVRDRLAQQDRRQVYNDWSAARFREERINGVLVLVTLDPPFVNVGAGRDTDITAFGQADRDRLQRTLAGAFHDKQFDRGLVEGTTLVRQTMDARAGGQRSAGAGAPVGVGGSGSTPSRDGGGVGDAPTSGRGGGFGFGSLLLFAVVIGVGLMLVRRLFASRQRQQGQYDPRYATPDQQASGYGGYNAGGGGGGFGRGLGGGLLGGLGGAWLYDHLFRRDNAAYGSDRSQQGSIYSQDPNAGAGGGGGIFAGDDAGDQFSSSGGGFGDDAGGGGGDFGGGGGDSSGGDF